MAVTSALVSIAAPVIVVIGLSVMFIKWITIVYQRTCIYCYYLILLAHLPIYWS
jgi:hypothetical protein